MKRLSLVFILIILITLYADACKCVGTYYTRQAFKVAKVIVSVKVLKVLSSIDPKDTMILKNGDTLISEPVYGYSKLLLITKTYKGKLSNDTIIIDGDKSNCELYLKVGHSYIIYADLNDGSLISSKCSRSGLLENHPDINFLERKLKRRKKNET